MSKTTLAVPPHIARLEAKGCTVIEWKTKGEFIYVLYRNSLNQTWCGTGVLGDHKPDVGTMSFVFPGIGRDNEQKEMYQSK
jgi:hypothetical protein